MAPPPRSLRADAQRNYAHLLEVARTVVAEQGTQASLREIARRAEVGLGTLYRHFPTRDALLEALLRESFDRLAASARALAATRPPEQALREWLVEFLAGNRTYRGLAASMMATLGDEKSALYASCRAMRQEAANLLERAQESGHVRADIDRLDLLALISSVGWIVEQAPVMAERSDHLFELVWDALTTPRSAGAARP
jgi:AcrR family transcriptional regulator